jgi:putative flippase GtrA
LANSGNGHQGSACGLTTFVRYVLFAVLATLANLLTQEAVLQLAPVRQLEVSILAGTVVGFALKYALDKRWIFYDAYTSHSGELRKVILYGLFSVVTTLIFWGFEVTFFTIWETSFAKYTGAVLGLAIGYAAKFFLDRAYVFRERQP